jgi:hypothetical protein
MQAPAARVGQAVHIRLITPIMSAGQVIVNPSGPAITSS